MRAVVDQRGLATLVGARPARSTMLSWALGSSLAAMAGILLAPVLQLNVQALTLLVVNAYAAAMVGRLRSVPLTFVGALVLGLAESYAVGYLPSTGLFANVRLAIPTLMLFVALLLLPEVRLSGGTTIAARMPRVPGLARSLAGGVALVAAAAAIAAMLDEDTLSKVAPGQALGLIALSLVRGGRARGAARRARRAACGAAPGPVSGPRHARLRHPRRQRDLHPQRRVR
jgi:branched-chain amino acid transport system permease protein